MHRKTISRSLILAIFVLPFFSIAQGKDWKLHVLPMEKKIRSAKSFELKKKELEFLKKELKTLSSSKEPMAETHRLEINTLLALMEEFSGKSKWKLKECRSKIIDVRARYEPSTDFDQKPKMESLQIFERLLTAFYGCK